MKYVTDHLTWQPKDYIDQPLHVLMGMWPIILAWYLFGSVIICWFVLAGNLIYLGRREYKQHTVSKVILNLDLMFGILGCVVGIVSVYILK